MSLHKKIGLVLAVSLILLTAFMLLFDGLRNTNVFGIEEFSREMKLRGYHGAMQEVTLGFLSTNNSKRLMVGNEAIDIYLYEGKRSMERDAQRISPDGSGYGTWIRNTHVSWVSEPHFFKKGKIIVQYVGINNGVISDLEDILGEQFAGSK